MIQDIYPRPLHLIGGAHLIKYNTGHWKIDVNCQRKRALISLKIGSLGLVFILLLCQHPIWASALPGPWSVYCLDRNTNLKVLVPTRMAGPMDAHASGWYGRLRGPNWSWSVSVCLDRKKRVSRLRAPSSKFSLPQIIVYYCQNQRLANWSCVQLPRPCRNSAPRNQLFVRNQFEIEHHFRTSGLVTQGLIPCIKVALWQSGGSC